MWMWPVFNLRFIYKNSSLLLCFRSFIQLDLYIVYEKQQHIESKSNTPLNIQFNHKFGENEDKVPLSTLQYRDLPIFIHFVLVALLFHYFLHSFIRNSINNISLLTELKSREKGFIFWIILLQNTDNLKMKEELSHCFNKNVYESKPMAMRWEKLCDLIFFSFSQVCVPPARHPNIKLENKTQKNWSGSIQLFFSFLFKIYYWSVFSSSIQFLLEDLLNFYVCHNSIMRF